MPEAATLAAGSPEALSRGAAASWVTRRPVTLAGFAGLSVCTAGAFSVLRPNGSFALVTIAAVVLAAATAAVEERGHRAISLNLFLWGFVTRLSFVTLCYFAASREGGPFLGPDATEYFNGSVELAARAFHLPQPAVIFFGSYDVGQYYLFALVVRYAHADLFGLQVMNCAFTALAAPLAYAVAREIVPRWAAAIGLAVALSPSLIGLSTIDLLKDPSIACALLGFVWLLLRLRTATQPITAAAFAVAALCLALYLRTSRFYVFAYLEAAVLLAMLVMWRGRVRAFARPLALALAVLVFGVAEMAPTRALWPTTPVMFLAMTGHTLNTAGMRWSTPGFLQRRVPGLARLPQEEKPSTSHGVLMLVVDMGRRVFGPFPWIAPRLWTFGELQQGQYYLFPGMLIWYAVLPFTLLGFAICGAAILKGAEHRFPVILVWGFTALYCAQYLLINLSFRQREDVMPFLLMFAALGVERVAPDWRHPPRWYGGYWLAIVIVAVLHLTARAILHLS